MKKLIYYPPGCYGTFVNWICNTNKPVIEKDLPFAEFGNSHRYYIDSPHTALFGPKHRDIFFKSSRDFGVLRSCWPLTTGVKLINAERQHDFYHNVCQADLQDLIAACDKILVLHPTDQSKVWWYQNFCEKVSLSQLMVQHTMSQNDNDISWLTTGDPVLRARYHLDLQKQQPGLDKLFELYNKTSALDFSTWQLRTALVEDLCSQTSNAYQCWGQLQQEFDTIKFVSIEQLRDNFQSTVIEILDFFNLEHGVVDSLPFIETEWQQRQEHLFKDVLINNIVDAIANNQDQDWTGQINFFDQVYIQKLLNDRGITVFNIDIWPTTTQQFWRIIK